MPKMFGFSRGRMKLGRLRGHLHDPFHGPRSPAHPTKRSSHLTREEPVATSVSGLPDVLAWRCSSDTFDLNGRAFENSENWAVLSTDGEKPSPRFDHAAAIVGSKMIVFGGDSGNHLLDDTKVDVLRSFDHVKDIAWFHGARMSFLSEGKASHLLTGYQYGHSTRKLRYGHIWKRRATFRWLEVVIQ